MQVHTIDLDDSFEGDLSVLSLDERARATRFRFGRDRRRFVNCRFALRRILSRHLNIDAASVRFHYNEYGKPSVDGLHFNISHADRIAMIAVSSSLEIGIDVERIDPAFANDQIPERFFTPREVRSLRALPESAQLEAFFHCWTRKEAYMKARGMGFALPSTSFDVEHVPEEWSLESIPAPAGYVAAICTRVLAPLAREFSVQASRSPALIAELARTDRR